MKQLYELHGEGRLIRRIARDLEVSRNSVPKHLRVPQVPRARPRPPRESKLDPFKGYLQRRLGDGLDNCVVLLSVGRWLTAPQSDCYTSTVIRGGPDFRCSVPCAAENPPGVTCCIGRRPGTANDPVMVVGWAQFSPVHTWKARGLASSSPSEVNIHNDYETGEHCGGMRNARFEVWTEVTDRKQRH